MSTPPQNPSTRGTQGTQPRTGDGGQSASQSADTARKDAKATAADNLGKLADSAKAAATQLEGEDVGHISQYVSELADGMTRFSSSLRDKSGDEILRDVARLARDNPALFVTGSVAIGFALTRFARASSEPEPGEPDSVGARGPMGSAAGVSSSVPGSTPGQSGSTGLASFDATRAPGSSPTSSDPGRPGTPRGGIH